MDTTPGKAAAAAMTLLLTVLALLPPGQAAPDGDTSRTFYFFPAVSATVQNPGIGFFGTGNNFASICAIGFTGSIAVPPPANVYLSNLRMYLNTGTTANLAALGYVGIPFFCPPLLMVGPPSPTNLYGLYVPAMAAGAALNIHLEETLGTLRPIGEVGVVTATDWDLGVCAVPNVVFTPAPPPMGSSAVKCGAANNAWIAVRDGNPKLTSATTGDVLADEVVAVGTGDVYVISCARNDISWVSPFPPFAGTRVADTHDYALLVDPTVPPAVIVADVLNHLGGAPPLQGVYDQSGDNGNPCDNGGPADGPLLY
ncbi:MAG: hypothetical protein QOG31_77 [Thermoplasmata archaeon]|jgi:hypothetical protein|nr:hypothetical protein [Thermoplasmata archaeon]